jgi:DNA mismatch endonuclease (patch repair protein)
MADIVSIETRSRMMSSIRARDTKPEMLVRRYLHALGFRYRLSPRELPGRPDLLLPKYRAAIFVHGCFWHGHEKCRFATIPSTRTEFWQEKISANKARDAAVVDKLHEMAWRVGVVWECALRSKRQEALTRLAEFIDSESPQVEIAE